MFDEYDDPQLDAEDILTSSVVRKKLANDAQIIRTLDADIVGLMEVENHQILRELCNGYLRQQKYYYFMLLEGKDPRGIDVALISKKPFLARSFAIPGFSRGILAARFSHKGQPYYVIVNHWKSRRDGGADQRIAAAKTLGQIVKTEIPNYEGKGVPVIIGGDLNDTDGDHSVKLLGEYGLRNSFRAVPKANRWTLGFYNRNTRDMELYGLDHILINQQAQSGPLLKWKSSAVVRPLKMINDRVINGKSIPMPLDDYKSRIGYSDHFPVMATFELK